MANCIGTEETSRLSPTYHSVIFGQIRSQGPAHGKSEGNSRSTTGLRGIAAASSSVSDVNGEKGELIYQGYNIHDLAQHSTFEEVAFLLWHKRLPNRDELAELKSSLAAHTNCPLRLLLC